MREFLIRLNAVESQKRAKVSCTAGTVRKRRIDCFTRKTSAYIDGVGLCSGALQRTVSAAELAILAA